MAITEGLARVGVKYNSYVRSNPTSQMNCLSGADSILEYGVYASANWVEWNIAPSRYGYGYGYGLNTLTSKIAASVLLISGPVATIAIAVRLLRNRSSDSWLVLAQRDRRSGRDLSAHRGAEGHRSRGRQAQDVAGDREDPSYEGSALASDCRR
ncbi:hypothetical protein MMC32_003932 [Xylographa parallela]|nr:hypothetical protein [Xylographa parallela]